MNIIVMGVSGSGKTTIGTMLSKQLGIPYFDGDDLHPEANKLKQSKKIPLTDEDRIPWLKTINKTIKSNIEGGCIIGSSALKETYRDIIKEDINEIHWIMLKGDFSLINKRMSLRKNHFMPVELLKSQFDTLEEPDYGHKINIDRSPDEIVSEIIAKISVPHE